MRSNKLDKQAHQAILIDFSPGVHHQHGIESDSSGLSSVFTFPFVFAHSDYLVLVMHWCINSAGCFWTLFVRKTIQQEEAKLKSEADFHVRQSIWRSSALPWQAATFCSHQVFSVANDILFRRGIPSILTSQSNLSTLASAMPGQQVPAGCVLVPGQLCRKREHQTSVICVPSLALKHFPVTQGKIKQAGLQNPGLAMLTKELHSRGLLFLARWYMGASGFYCLMYSTWKGYDLQPMKWYDPILSFM